jgi:hypothetical protein
VGGVASHDEAGVPVVLASQGPVLVIRLHLQDNHVRLPHQVLLVFEGLQHSLDRVATLTHIALGVNLHWLDPLLNDWVVGQIEVEDNFYRKGLRFEKVTLNVI